MPSHLRDPDELSVAAIEAIEKLCLRSAFQAVVDFGFDAYEIFLQSTVDVRKTAEDITREMLDRIGGYQIADRVQGNVDYRKARYVILPDYLVRQWLFVVSQADESAHTAILKRSSTSLVIDQDMNGSTRGSCRPLPTISEVQGLRYLTTTLLAYYNYLEREDRRELKFITLAAIPNGKLRAIYNPSSFGSLSQGEEFQFRLSFDELAARASWRIQRVIYDPGNRAVSAEWSDSD